METTAGPIEVRGIGRIAPGAVVLAGLIVLLWAPLVPHLLSLWRGNDTMGHGPLVPLVTAALLWTRRKKLTEWTSAAPAGLALLMASALAHVLSVWVDIQFLQMLSLVGIIAGSVWYLGGSGAFAASVGALGFLVFMIPWPTTVVERLAFPLQLTSSAYAAILCGLMGLPIQREGVHLAVQPNPDADPIYSVLVARQCSGLTSLIVLLALGYLVAYHTPVRLGWKALLVALVVPLALLSNAIRLSLILLAGANHGEKFATWVHDNEAPVLIFLCCLALLGLRSAVMHWARRPAGDRVKSHEASLAAG
jgi:exosortase